MTQEDPLTNRWKCRMKEENYLPNNLQQEQQRNEGFNYLERSEDLIIHREMVLVNNLIAMDIKV